VGGVDEAVELGDAMSGLDGEADAKMVDCVYAGEA